jgi:hypothetical protein
MEFFDFFEKVLFITVFVLRMSMLLATFFEFKSRFEKSWSS